MQVWVSRGSLFEELAAHKKKLAAVLEELRADRKTTLGKCRPAAAKPLRDDIRDYLKDAADKLDAMHLLPAPKRSIEEMRLAEQMRNFAVEAV
jgi:hypothetical protein